MILFQAEVKIDFKLDSDYHLGAKSTSKNFVAAGKNYILFGDEHRRQKFESIVIHTEPLEELINSILNNTMKYSTMFTTN